jgi:hypothetical protein
MLHYFSLQVNQPQQVPVMVVNEAPDDYILPAILSCIFCCIQLGIGAIVAACIVSFYVCAPSSLTEVIIAKTMIIHPQA